MHYLAHDGAGWGHDRSDTGGQDGGNGSKPFTDILAGHPDFGAPIEFDIDHCQTLAGLAAHSLNPRGSYNCGFQGLGDEGFDFFGGKSGAFGE